MKKSRKIFTGVICAVMAFSSALPIYAVEERGAVTPCPKCAAGAVSHHEISREWTGEIIIEFCKICERGVNRYMKVKVPVEQDCDKCSFNNITSYIDRYYLERCDHSNYAS